MTSVRKANSNKAWHGNVVGGKPRPPRPGRSEGPTGPKIRRDKDGRLIIPDMSENPQRPPADGPNQPRNRDRPNKPGKPNRERRQRP